jgi:NADH-quinone oxidoreductase subunit C
MTDDLEQKVKQRFDKEVDRVFVAQDKTITLELVPVHLINVAKALYDEPDFDFKLLVDICGVDYSQYGETEWRTTDTTFSGFSRGKEYTEKEQVFARDKTRFAVVYHFLSLNKNQRIRLRVFLPDNEVNLPSVNSIWNAANWFERETFDLYGIVFDGHPDLRRLLTDYGFVGHPFRKDFPLIGEVELRYDAEQERCVYGPVSIQARVTVPKVIRSDSRYYREEEPTT